MREERKRENRKWGVYTEEREGKGKNAGKNETNKKTFADRYEHAEKCHLGKNWIE